MNNIIPVSCATPASLVHHSCFFMFFAQYSKVSISNRLFKCHRSFHITTPMYRQNILIHSMSCTGGREPQGRQEHCSDWSSCNCKLGGELEHLKAQFHPVSKDTSPGIVLNQVEMNLSQTWPI